MNGAALLDFLHTRFGYGNPQAHLWFLGLEESMGGGEEDFRRRLDVWVDRRKPAWDDVRGYHQALGDSVFMEDPARPDRSQKPQPTWSFLAKILMRYRGDDRAVSGAFLHWNTDDFGARASDHALAELLPLPKLRAASLPAFYGGLGRHELGCLGTYHETWLHRRAQTLCTWLPKGRCAVVVYVTNAQRRAVLDGLNRNLRLEIDAEFRTAVNSLIRRHVWRTTGQLAVCFSSFAGQGQMTDDQAFRIGAEARAWVTNGRAPP